MRKLICPGIILPWCEGDLGAAYNEWLDELGYLYHWIVYQDHDVEMMHRDWQARLESAIRSTSGAGCFTCKVNRQHDGNMGQSLHIQEDQNDAERIATARDVRAAGGDRVTHLPPDPHHFMSGCWFAVNVDAVREIGGFCSGFQGVDWDIHERLEAAGFPVYVIEGLYCHHRYRHPMEAE